MTIFRLLGILPQIINGTNVERCILFRGFYHTLKGKKEKGWVFSKLQGGSLRTIFRFLGILPKIIDETNGERCILLKGFYPTLIEKKDEKSLVFPRRGVVVGAPFSDF